MIRQDDHQLISHLEREDLPEILRVVKELEVKFFLYFGDHSKDWISTWTRRQTFVVFDQIVDLIEEDDTHEESEGCW